MLGLEFELYFFGIFLFVLFEAVMSKTENTVAATWKFFKKLRKIVHKTTYLGSYTTSSFNFLNTQMFRTKYFVF